MSLFDFSTKIGFDIETSGDKPEYALQPFRALTGIGWPTVAAFCREDKDPLALMRPQAEKLRSILRGINEKKITLVGWNVAFDAAWLIALGLEEEVFAAQWLDGMLLWRHAVVEPEGEDVPQNKRKSYSLEAAMHEFYPDDAGFKEFTDFHTKDPEELKKLAHRCGQDTLWSLRLAGKFWNMLNDRQQRAALIEARCIPQVALTNVRGIKMSSMAADALGIRLEEVARSTKEKLMETNPEIDGVNLGSPKQLAELLFDVWGLPCEKMTKGTEKNPEGNRSTDKEVLFDLAALDPKARLLRSVRESLNCKAKYAVATVKSLEYNGDGFARPNAKIFSTYTSRMTYSSTQEADVEYAKTKTDRKTKEVTEEVKTKRGTLQVGVALHQWRRGAEYRRLIEAPEGFDVLELDFAGQEFRWMAVASGDETMLSLCAPGQDAHSYMGAQIAQMNYHELIRLVHEDNAEANIKRKLGKFANLSFQYRVGPKTATAKARVEYELDVDETFIKQILSTYKAAFPGVVQYWQRSITQSRQLGYAETFAGRRVQLNGNWGNKRESWKLESTAINYPIQGTGGDQKYLALAVARNMLPKYGGRVYYELHDGLFFIIPKAKTETAAHELRHALSNLPYKAAWGTDLPIQFPVDGKIGRSWGDLKGFE